MVATAELSQSDIYTLFDAMDQELASHGSEFAFVQLRMSAERFAVPICGLAAEKTLCTLKPDQYHVYFEKKLQQFKQGPVDLVLVPTSSGTPYCFEFKMVWMKGINGNIAGIRKDFEKLSGYDRGFVAAVLFSFNTAPDWAPYAHKGDMEQLAKQVVAEIGKPVYEGKAHQIASHEVKGEVKLIAWVADNWNTSKVK
jgi:hypothetical protein